MNNDLIHRSAALAVLEELKNHVASPDPVGEVADAIETMRKVQAVDAEPVRHGCEYCSGRRTEYYHTTNTKLYINTFGNAQVLETECNPCPPYSNCSLRGIPVRSAFIINYCPNCGRKLDGGIKDAAD